MYKQIIIVKKDNNTSMTQITEYITKASLAFITETFKNEAKKVLSVREGKAGVPYKHTDLCDISKQAEKDGKSVFYYKDACICSPNGKYVECDPEYVYRGEIYLNQAVFEEWSKKGGFDKCVLSVDNEKELLSVKSYFEQIGMREGSDFFLLKEKNGRKNSPCCIGCAPMQKKEADKIVAKMRASI